MTDFNSHDPILFSFLATSHGHGSGIVTWAWEPRFTKLEHIPPSLHELARHRVEPGWKRKLKTRSRKNCLGQSSCFFFLFLQYPIITRHDIPHPPVEISFHLSTWERERYIDSIYRGLFHEFLNSIFIEDCSASSSIVHIRPRRDSSLIKKPRWKT